MTLFHKVFQKHLEEQEAAALGSAGAADSIHRHADPLPEAASEPFTNEPHEIEVPTVTEENEGDALAEDNSAGPAPDLVARAIEAQQMLQQSPVTPQPDPSVESAPPARNRNKTRLLGFGSEAALLPDPFEAKSQDKVPASFPCGWLVVVDGPGRGASHSLHAGVMQIGRGEGQAIRLDFGDRAISRENHAAVAYDAETGKFFLGHGGKSNIVRLNGRPVLSTEELAHGDTLRIGETELRFAALCDDNFTWSVADE